MRVSLFGFSSSSGPIYELGRTLVKAAAEPYFKILVSVFQKLLFVDDAPS